MSTEARITETADLLSKAVLTLAGYYLSFPCRVWDPPHPLTTHLGLIRLATTMMSLTLADVFILAPEPIVMATSFSVRV